MASVMLAVTSFAIADEFKITNEYVQSLPTALFVLGFGLGPLFLAPLSESWGRRPIYLGCFIVFTISNVLCSVAPNMAALAVFDYSLACLGQLVLVLGERPWETCLRQKLVDERSQSIVLVLRVDLLWEG